VSDIFKRGQVVRVKDNHDDDWEDDIFGNFDGVNSSYPYNCLREQWRYCRLPSTEEYKRLREGYNE